MIKSVGPVTLQGAGADDLAFRSMRFVEGMSQPFHFSVDVLSDKPDLDANTYLGQPLSVVLDIEKKAPRVFSGIVTEFGLQGSVGEHTLYRIELRPWLWLLQLVSNCRIFQNTTVPDIVMAVFRKHGFSDVELRLSAPHPPRLYVVQYRESDFNFVSRLLEDEGIYYYFSHTPGQHLLVLCDSLAAHDPTPGFEKLPYHPPDPNRLAAVDSIDRWQVKHRVESGAYALRDYNFEAVRVEMDAPAEIPAQHGHGAYEVFDYPGGYADNELGKATAKRRLQEAQAKRRRAEAQSNARGLAVGALLTLEKHPVAAQNRQYLILSLRGDVRSNALESGGNEQLDGEVYRCEFECLDIELPYQPPRITPRPLVHGAQTAIVVGEKNSEIFTEDYGRVKLQFHWDRESPGNEDSSCWVRVAQRWAGSGFGAVFTPRIGQEVLVEFLEGDPDRPIVTGSVYNSDNKPPYLPLNPTQSGIKTRSTLQGADDNFNEIRFDDKKGAEQLFVQAEKDHTINVKNNRSASIAAADSISVGASRSVSVSKDLTTTVGTGGAAQSTLTVTGKHNVDVSDTIEVTAATHIKLSVGSSTLMITPDYIELISGGKSSMKLDINAFTQSSGGSSVLLDANACMTANGEAQVLLDGNALMTSKGKSKVLLDGDATLDSASGTANVTAAVKVALAGSSSGGKVDLEAAGATVSGPKVSVSGASLTEVSGAVVKIN